MPRDHARPERGVGVAAPDGAFEAELTRLLLQNPADVPANLINASLVARRCGTLPGKVGGSRQLPILHRRDGRGSPDSGDAGSRAAHCGR